MFSVLFHVLMALTVLLQIASFPPNDPVSLVPACAQADSPHSVALEAQEASPWQGPPPPAYPPIQPHRPCPER